MGHKQSKPYVHWCPDDGTPLSVGCGNHKRSLMVRDLFKRVSELDQTLLTRTETVFYILAILALLLTMGVEIAKIRSKKRANARMMQNEPRFVDDVEKDGHNVQTFVSGGAPSI